VCTSTVYMWRVSSLHAEGCELEHFRKDREKHAIHSYWSADVDAPPASCCDASAARRQCPLQDPLCGSVSTRLSIVLAL